jgi:tetratricopeptide (TPR) repeat protein
MPAMKRWLPWLAVALAAIACYAPTLGYGLVYDDKQLASSPLISRPFDFLALLRNEFYPQRFQYIALYRPLSQWSLLLNWRANELLFGAGDFGPGFHAVNILLHASASLLLLAWLRALPLRGAIPFVAALLFAVHPIHTEAIANVSARSEPMALLFGLAFLLAHRRGALLPAALLYLAAMWSKESAAAFAGVAVAADLLFPEAGRRPPFSRWATYAAVLCVWLALRALALHGTTPAIVFIDNPTADAPALERVLTAAAVQLDYLRLLALPLSQSIDYSYAQTDVVRSALDPRVILFAAVLAASLAAAVLLRRRAPVVSLSVAGYALLFSVASNLLFPIGSIEAERLAYMPSAFFCLLVASALTRPGILLSKAFVAGFVTVLAAGLVALTLRQERVWKDESTLFREAVLTAPRSAKSHLNLAQQLEREGDLRGSVREYEESARIYPRYVYTWFLLGNLRHRLEETDAAVAAWRTALAVDPGLSDARANLASALLDLSRRAESAAEARELFSRDLFHPQLPAIQDRLAAGADPQERTAARIALAEGRAALAAGDAIRAIARAQEAAAGPALGRDERAEALDLLALGWERLGREGRARTFRDAARRLSAPETPRDPASR